MVLTEEYIAEAQRLFIAQHKTLKWMYQTWWVQWVARVVMGGFIIYSLLNHTLTSQSRLWAYVDDFRYMALMCFACVPLVLFFKRAKPKPGVIHAE